MKAKDIEKVSITLEGIYDSIEIELRENPSTCNYGISDSVFISEEVKSQLMQDGFKLSIGKYNQLGYVGFGLKIEW